MHSQLGSAWNGKKKKFKSFKTKGRKKLRNVALLRGETSFQGEVKKV